ncbi:MAG: MerR family transcriptional regulator [Longimicrobiales bacterium]
MALLRCPVESLDRYPNKSCRWTEVPERTGQDLNLRGLPAIDVRPLAPVPGYSPYNVYMSTAERLSTGQLAEAADVGVQTVRYYERRGLLPPPPRTEGGHRQYGPDDLRRLEFIRRAQELGFQLDEIQELLGLRVVEGEPCEAVAEKADQVIARIDERLADLRSMRSALVKLRRACEMSEPTEPCPILGSLENPS